MPILDTVYAYYPDTSSAKNRLYSITQTNLSANGSINQQQVTTYSYQFYVTGIPSQIAKSGAGGTITRNYDPAGNLTSVVDANGNAISYASYNGLGLPASVTDPNGYTVNFTYDALGHVLTRSRTVDGVSGTTTYTYDGLGNVLTVTNAGGGTLLHTYDAVGRLTQRTPEMPTKARAPAAMASRQRRRPRPSKPGFTIC